MTELVDTNSLAYSFGGISAKRQAAKVERFGWWYQAEWRLIAMRAYWTSIIGTALLTPALYLIAMGLGLGRLVDAGAGGLSGVSYLVFVAPGLLVSTVVISTTSELTYPVLDGFIWSRTFSGRAATAASVSQVASGELIAVAIRMIGEAAVFWVVLLAFGAVGFGWSWVMIPVAALAGLAFGAPLMAFAATLQTEGFEFALIQRFAVVPMFLFAGTFYPLETMPIYLQWIGWISPMWHGTQLARFAAFGLPLSGWQVLGHLGFLAVLVGVGWALSVRSFRRRLHR